MCIDQQSPAVTAAYLSSVEKGLWACLQSIIEAWTGLGPLINRVIFKSITYYITNYLS